MNTLETDVEIGADGSVRLLSPLPAWLKPGWAHVRLTVATPASGDMPKMVARRMAALSELQAMG
ncbi:MAG: hypothetical protein R3F13_21465 [Prosthecobacter sp.]